ncbi:unnamed protein product, partial [marine sediment metagenome]
TALNDVGEGEAIAAYEVTIPKETEESPGFETLIAMLALLIIAPIAYQKARNNSRRFER